MKSFTDIEQSNVLKDILPIESVDMYYHNRVDIPDEDGNDYNLTIVKESLQYQLYYHDSWGQVDDIETNYYDDLIDACYEMILKLKEHNLL